MPFDNTLQAEHIWYEGLTEMIWQKTGKCGTDHLENTETNMVKCVCMCGGQGDGRASILHMLLFITIVFKCFNGLTLTIVYLLQTNHNHAVAAMCKRKWETVKNIIEGFAESFKIISHVWRCTVINYCINHGYRWMNNRHGWQISGLCTGLEKWNKIKFGFGKETLSSTHLYWKKLYWHWNKHWRWKMFNWKMKHRH